MKLTILVIILLAAMNTARAAQSLSVTVSLASDYLFNGVSQTNNNPALQGILHWQQPSGVYAGVFASNVDFNEGTNTEIDIYAGYTAPLNETMTFDLGLAQYTYAGHTDSDKLNYVEFWSKLTWQNSTIAYWYSADYAGTGAGHSIYLFKQLFQLNDRLALALVIDKSMSHDRARFVWQANDQDYVHGKVELQWQPSIADVTFALESTDLSAYDDVRLLVTLSKTLSF